MKKKAKRRAKAPKPAPGDYALLERKLPGRRFVHFPLMKGRVVEAIELFTMAEHHSLTIQFQDKTALSLEIEPLFMLRAALEDRKGDDIRTIRQWQPIPGEPWLRH